MNNSAICVEGLGKRYQLGGDQARYRTLRETLWPFGQTAGQKKQSQAQQTLWALRGVSFEVPSGTALGVIGANGAGKSTLLKILSRITDPTEGRAVIRGRVGSLLEVGTGFHPELTGRENIYLNASILGMRQAEVRRRFDAIVAFSEIERFLDTPVKRYSSGMYVRLAFAVAAHLELEILLVDEVLAVGDLSFQRRCLSKMEEISAGSGRTVLFVSHNLAAISMLTKRCLWIDGGTVKAFGSTHEVVRSYLQAQGCGSSGGIADLRNIAQGRPPGAVGRKLEMACRFTELRLLNREGLPAGEFLENDPIRIEVGFHAAAPAAALEILCKVKTPEGVVVFTAMTGSQPGPKTAGLHKTACAIAPNPLRPGRYTIELLMVTGIAQDFVSGAIAFDVIGNAKADDNPRYARDGQLGLVRVDYPWSAYQCVEETGREKIEQLREAR